MAYSPMELNYMHPKKNAIKKKFAHALNQFKQLYSICAKHSFHLILSGPWYPGRQGMKQIEPATPRILYFFIFLFFNFFVELV